MLYGYDIADCKFVKFEFHYLEEKCRVMEAMCVTVYERFVAQGDSTE